MYIPAHFRNENEAELVGFTEQCSFALLCNNAKFPRSAAVHCSKQEQLLFTRRGVQRVYG